MSISSSQASAKSHRGVPRQIPAHCWPCASAGSPPSNIAMHTKKTFASQTVLLYIYLALQSTVIDVLIVHGQAYHLASAFSRRTVAPTHRQLLTLSAAVAAARGAPRSGALRADALACPRSASRSRAPSSPQTCRPASRLSATTPPETAATRSVGGCDTGGSVPLASRRPARATGMGRGPRGGRAAALELAWMSPAEQCCKMWSRPMVWRLLLLQMWVVTAQSELEESVLCAAAVMEGELRAGPVRRSRRAPQRAHRTPQ